MSQADLKLIQFTGEKRYVRDFLSLAKRLYGASDNMEDPSAIKALLLGEHPLSRYFRLDKFLVYSGKKAVGRFVITTYENDDNAYLGFFECINDAAAAAFLFKEAEGFCQRAGYRTIVGPVDASFWIKYRLKINRFDKRPYTGEPYNKDYYYDLFLQSGYEVAEHYVSNDYGVIPKDYVNPKFFKRYRDFTSMGYEIKSPTAESFDEMIGDVYRMITELYRNFPVYKQVEEEEFRQVFGSYKTVMSKEMTKLAYLDGKAVGFYITVPDYGNSVYHLNPINILKLLRIRKKPHRYIMLYMGVEKEHLGLGGALVHSILEELKQQQVPSIGALCRDGKVTQKYVSDLITDSYEYVLLKKNLQVD